MGRKKKTCLEDQKETILPGRIMRREGLENLIPTGYNEVKKGGKKHRITFVTCLGK